MNKLKFIFLFSLPVVLIASLLLLPACKETAPEVMTETVVETVTKTVTETVTVEVEAESPYTYEKLREMAEADAYEGEPAKGHKIAHAKQLSGWPFLDDVEKSVKDEWALAGGAAEDLLVVDHNNDIATAMANADVVISFDPEVYVAYGVSEASNFAIARKFQETDIFVVGIDMSFPPYPFMGNSGAVSGAIIGNWIVDNVDDVYGGIDNVDLIVFQILSLFGENVIQRTTACVGVMVEAFGEVVDPGPELGAKPEGSKAITIEFTGVAEEAMEAFSGVLTAYPDAKNIIVLTIGGASDTGVISAFEMSDRDDWDAIMLLSHDGDSKDRQFIRDGKLDAACEYFPDRYGKYLVPAALAYIYGNPVPAYMYVDNVMLTKDNVDQWYPND